MKVVIIGGSAAGIIAAVTAKKAGADVVVIREKEKAVIPCGIPYIFGELGFDVSKDELKFDFSKFGIEFVKGKVVEIDRGSKLVRLEDGREIGFDKLILATGSAPAKLPIEGIELEGVYFMKKDFEYLSEIAEKLRKAEKIVIIGGGAIGVELAEQLVKAGKEVHVVELLEHCLQLVLDPEFAELVDKELEKIGVRLHLKTSVSKIEGSEKAERVLLSNGEVIEADAVVVSVGVKKNVELAKKAGLEVDEKLGIIVNEYMQTSDPNIYACGDCAAKKDFVTGKPSRAMLASVACYEARIAGYNAVNGNVRKNYGTIGAFSTTVNGTVFASAGLTEGRAKQEGIEVKVGYFEAPSTHPGSLDPRKVKLKLIFRADSMELIGAELVAPERFAETINLAAELIRRRAKAEEIALMQIATQPKLTPPPTLYHFVKAAEMVL